MDPKFQALDALLIPLMAMLGSFEMDQGHPGVGPQALGPPEGVD